MKKNLLVIVFCSQLATGLSSGMAAGNSSAMQKDYDKWMKSTPLGTTIDWASGKLTRTETGARFVDSLGMVTLLPEKQPDFNYIARDNPNIAKAWSDQYGFKVEKTVQSPAPSASPTKDKMDKTDKTDKSDNLDFLTKLKTGSIDMLIEASKKYKSGSLSKEKYIEISLQVAQVAEYEKNTKGALATTQTYDPNKWLEVNQAILPQMRKDFQSYIDSTVAGEVKDWAGGKLFRRAGGALYVGPDGDSFFINENSPSGAIDFNTIALRNANIASEWKSSYGFQPVGETSFQNQRGFSADSFTKNIPGGDYWYSKPYGVTIKKWIAENYNSLKPGESKKWNEYTLVRSGNPNCLMILSKEGSKHTSLCMSDDYDRNLVNDPFGTEVAQKYFGYKP